MKEQAVADNYDAWDVESGLSDLESFTFRGVHFGYDAEYMNGERCLMIVEEGIGVTDDGTTIDDMRKLYPCGKDWEPAEGGKSVRHPTKNQPKFNAQSGMGLLVTAARAVFPELPKRGAPTEAATWEGLQFKMENKEFTFKGDDGTQTYTRLLPTEYIGEKGSANGTGAKKATRARKAPAAEKDEASETAEESGVPKALGIKLKKLAKTIVGDDGDFDRFLEDAYEIDGVDGNTDVEGALEGIWEAAQE